MPDELFNADDAQKVTVAERIAASLPDFELAEDNLEGVPGLTHIASGIKFRIIWPGMGTMGFTERDEALAREIDPSTPLQMNLEEMRPVIPTSFEDLFLVSELPVLEAQYCEAVPTENVLDQEAYSPALVSHEEALAFCSHYHFRLLGEAEWEYACQSGRGRLFVWGDTLPERKELARWMELNCEDANLLPSNTFGLKCLFSGEWCAEEYKMNHSSSGEVLQGVHVVKGGGALFWPWQDNEWVWCIPAMRIPSTDTFDQTCAFRVAVDIGRRAME